jgi:hypothetical protein
MKDYNLLDAQDFQRAVEDSGLDVGVLRAIRFGMAYSSKGKITAVKPDIPARQTVGPYATNVINLSMYKALRNFKMLED